MYKHLLTVVAFAIQPLGYKSFLVNFKIFDGPLQTWNKETTKVKKENNTH